MPGKLRITLVKSSIGYREQQKRTLRALRLHRLHQTVEHEDSPAVRGMIGKVEHLVKVEADLGRPASPPCGPRTAPRLGAGSASPSRGEESKE